ncbi:MAG: NUDIX domain-containing protein [Planctomycetota bacterium]|nr:MAG: NUDIX domain-containing protein [Planctomycetota bacterium]
MSPATSPTVEAAGLVLLTRTQPPQVLLLKHPRRWDLPKGHVEAGEDLMAAALRETEEETGIPASQIEIDPAFRWTIEYDVQTKKRGAYHKRVTYFLGWIDRPLPVRVTEHEGYQWVVWPPGPMQSETIDPLLASLRQYLDRSTLR